LRHRQKIASLFAVSYASIAEWNTFLAVEAGAAATLTGLVFVALSINLSRILVIPGLSGRGAESIMQFLQAFFISTVAFIPRQPERTFAIEVLFIAAASWGALATVQVRYLKVRPGHPWSWFVNRARRDLLACARFHIFVCGRACKRLGPAGGNTPRM
jgi:hypothetical protein